MEKLKNFSQYDMVMALKEKKNMDYSERRYVHPWNHCHHCGAAPITGRRHHCRSCIDGPDNDLCETCFQSCLEGRVKHPMPGKSQIHRETTAHEFETHEGRPVDTFSHWLEQEMPGSPEPALPHPFVCRLVIEAGMETAIIGYAFVARPDSNASPVLLTALHVLDPLLKHFNINLDIQASAPTGRELPEKIDRVNMYDVFALHWMMAPLGEANRMMTLPGARTGEEEPFSDKDIAAFSLSALHVGDKAFLAETAPGVGEPVWLAARNDANHHKNMFRAVVVESTDRSLVYRFEPGAAPPKYCSGAPIINQNGEITGIAVGTGRLNGQTFGHANHAGNIRRHLNNVLP